MSIETINLEESLILKEAEQKALFQILTNSKEKVFYEYTPYPTAEEVIPPKKFNRKIVKVCFDIIGQAEPVEKILILKKEIGSGGNGSCYLATQEIVLNYENKTASIENLKKPLAIKEMMADFKENKSADDEVRFTKVGLQEQGPTSNITVGTKEIPYETYVTTYEKKSEAEKRSFSEDGYIDDGIIQKKQVINGIRNDVYYAMPYIQGIETKKLLDEYKDFSFDERLSMIYALMRAYDEQCYQKSIYHGDIKHKNLQTNIETFNCCLFDFGSASNQKDDKNFAGTILFMPPEVDQKDRKDSPPIDREKVDVFSLGATAYSMLGGSISEDRKPENATQKEIVNTPLNFKKLLSPYLNDPALKQSAQALMRTLEQMCELNSNERINFTKAYESISTIMNSRINSNLTALSEVTSTLKTQNASLISQAATTCYTEMPDEKHIRAKEIIYRDLHAQATREINEQKAQLQKNNSNAMKWFNILTNPFNNLMKPLKFIASFFKKNENEALLAKEETLEATQLMPLETRIHLA